MNKHEQMNMNNEVSTLPPCMLSGQRTGPLYMHKAIIHRFKYDTSSVEKVINKTSFAKNPEEMFNFHSKMVRVNLKVFEKEGCDSCEYCLPNKVSWENAIKLFKSNESDALKAYLKKDIGEREKKNEEDWRKDGERIRKKLELEEDSIR